MSKKKQYLETFNETVDLLNKHNKCALVRPTGFGKTTLFLDLVRKNVFNSKNILFVYPTKTIYNIVYNELEDKIKYVSYSYLAIHNDDVKFALEYLYEEDDIDIDFIFFDEMHKIGGEKTEIAVKNLIDTYPDAKILGATATEVRSDGKDIKQEFFDGITVSDYTLEDAFEDELLIKPHYVYCMYDTKDLTKNLKNKIKNNVDSHYKKSFNDELKSLEISISKINNMPEIIHKHITENIKDQSYFKFIVFNPTREILIDNKSKVEVWFHKAFPSYDIETLVITSGNSSERKNLDKLDNLVKKENTIDLIFAIDMLNLGYHIDDLTGIMMLRGTQSDIIFNQQIGRCLAVNNTEKKIVFDLVNNIFKESYYTKFLSKNNRDDYNLSSLERDYNKKDYINRTLYASDYVAKINEILEKFNYAINKNIENSICYWYTEKSMPLNIVSKKFKLHIDEVKKILLSNNIIIEEEN